VKIVSRFFFVNRIIWNYFLLALMAASFECEPPETEHDRDQLRSLR